MAEGDGDPSLSSELPAAYSAGVELPTSPGTEITPTLFSIPTPDVSEIAPEIYEPREALDGPADLFEHMEVFEPAEIFDPVEMFEQPAEVVHGPVEIAEAIQVQQEMAQVEAMMNKVLVESEKPAPLPTVQELGRFVLPTLAMWLAPPFLSLIDTSVVGMHCATSSLAALAPSTKLCDNLSYLCTALGAATTNIAAERLAQKEPEAAKRVVAGSLAISLVLGTVLAVGMPLVARQVLGALMGGAAAVDGAVLESATQYTVIRALGFPAALLTMVLQGGFLATKDAFSPLVAVPLAALTNLVLDIFLVGSVGLGTAGAAWGTVASLYVNAFTLLAMWWRKARSLDAHSPLIRLPTRSEARRLALFVLPMAVALASRVSMCISITMAAVSLGTAALAANQVVETVYWLFCPFGEGISLCMQAYLPSIFLRGKEATKQLANTVLRTGRMLAIVAGVGAALTPIARPSLFTSCSAVRSMMSSSAPWLGLSIATSVMMSAREGMLLARQKLRQIALAHTAASVLLIAAFSRVTRLDQVWRLMAGINLLRMFIFAFAVKRAEAEPHA